LGFVQRILGGFRMADLKIGFRNIREREAQR
jgi:hypothetical protein